MSATPFELRYSCLEYAKNFHEIKLSALNARIESGIKTRMDYDIQLDEILNTAHKCYLFINGNFDLLPEITNDNDKGQSNV